jgi:hypothetical protein
MENITLIIPKLVSQVRVRLLWCVSIQTCIPSSPNYQMLCDVEAYSLKRITWWLLYMHMMSNFIRKGCFPSFFYTSELVCVLFTCVLRINLREKNGNKQVTFNKYFRKCVHRFIVTKKSKCANLTLNHHNYSKIVKTAKLVLYQHLYNIYNTLRHSKYLTHNTNTNID